MRFTSLLRTLLIFALVLANHNIFSQNLNIPELPAGDSIIIVSSVTINTPFTNNPPRLAKQHTISGNNFTSVVSDDPETAAANDSTFTLVVTQPLPITLSTITALRKNSGIEVTWTVLQEINVDRYEVERSPEGRHFDMIGTVVANSTFNTIANYAFFDPNPFIGLNFYRLKIVDKSGEISYSDIIKINTANAQESQVTAYPNPLTSNTFKLSMNNLKKGTYTISIFNNLGQEVIRKTLNHMGGAAVEHITLPETFPSGIFEIRLQGEGISVVKKMMKN